MTKTQEAEREAARLYSEGRKAVTAAAREEFPVGTKVKWRHVHGKPMTRAVVVAVGYTNGDFASTRWDVRTASGVVHSIECSRLYPEDAPE